MSKSDERRIKDTSGTAFRKIDVDQYEDDFKEEDADVGVTGPQGPDENEILSLLSQYPFNTCSYFSLFSLSFLVIFLNSEIRVSMLKL